MKQFVTSCLALIWLFALVGCTHPMKKTAHLNLGMTAEDVREAMGAPYSVRSAKLLTDEETTMVWEYWPPILAQNTEKVHVYFENGRVVQWGLPGDYKTSASTSKGALQEYKPEKSK